MLVTWNRSVLQDQEKNQDIITNHNYGSVTTYLNVLMFYYPFWRLIFPSPISLPKPRIRSRQAVFRELLYKQACLNGSAAICILYLTPRNELRLFIKTTTRKFTRGRQWTYGYPSVYRKQTLPPVHRTLLARVCMREKWEIILYRLFHLWPHFPIMEGQP